MSLPCSPAATLDTDTVPADTTDLAVALDEAGVTVLLDDRKASPGVKFADAEILGMPTIVVVGRGFADGQVELRDRRSGDRREVPVDDALADALQRAVEVEVAVDRAREPVEALQRGGPGVVLRVLVDPARRPGRGHGHPSRVGSPGPVLSGRLPAV